MTEVQRPRAREISSSLCFIMVKHVSAFQCFLAPLTGREVSLQSLINFLWRRWMEKSPVVGRCQESVLIRSVPEPGPPEPVWSVMEEGQARRLIFSPVFFSHPPQHTFGSPSWTLQTAQQCNLLLSFSKAKWRARQTVWKKSVWKLLWGHQWFTQVFVPLRPIFTCISGPWCDLSRYLCDLTLSWPTRPSSSLHSLQSTPSHFYFWALGYDIPLPAWYSIYRNTLFNCLSNILLEHLVHQFWKEKGLWNQIDQDWNHRRSI